MKKARIKGVVFEPARMVGVEVDWTTDPPTILRRFDGNRQTDMLRAGIYFHLYAKLFTPDDFTP